MATHIRAQERTPPFGRHTQKKKAGLRAEASPSLSRFLSGYFLLTVTLVLWLAVNPAPSVTVRTTVKLPAAA